jgi:hypothetical protein
MKKIYQIGIAAAACILLLACEKSDKGAGGEPLTLTGPTDKVVLLAENENETALTFTWNKGIERNPTDTITYIFRMDIAGNDFTTATPRDTVTDFTKSFTVSKLNELIIEQWLIHPGEEVLLEARVVANVKGEKFIYPEIATTTFSVVTYDAFASVPLYLTGTANPTATPIMLTEILGGQVYRWSGNLNGGLFKFVYDPVNDLPSLNKGQDNNTLVERTGSDQPDDQFQITAGVYNIEVRRKDMTISYEKTYEYHFEHIYPCGDVFSWGWVPADAADLVWNEGIFVWEGPLTADGADEDAFKILTLRDWGGYNIRPVVDWAPITDNRLTAYIGGADNQKWKLKPEESGNYRITINLSNMTITFDKLD